jgi:hypothetical protein
MSSGEFSKEQAQIEHCKYSTISFQISLLPACLGVQRTSVRAAFGGVQARASYHIRRAEFDTLYR